MKRIFLPILILISSGAYSANNASNLANLAGTKGKNLNIVCIEGRQLQQNSDESKEIEKKLTAVGQQIESDIKALEMKIQSEVSNLQNKAKLLNAETLEIEQDKILKLGKEYDIKKGQAKEDFQRKVNIELGKFQKKVQDSVNDLAAKNGWDLVIMKESGEIIYASEKADATSEVLQYLNKNFSESKKTATVKNKA